MGKYAVVEYTHENTTESKREFQAQVLEMRTAGLSFPHIGRALGVSHGYCYRMYKEALNAIITPGVELLRKQESERLDNMLIPLMGKIMEARNAAIEGRAYEAPIDEINAALKVSERRARIFGLDAPTKIAQSPTAGTPIEMLQEMNLTGMDNAELLKLRDLLAKASQSEGAEHATDG